MNDAGFSSDDERWPLTAVLTWIATRSLKYTESYAFKNPVDADYFISMAREGSGAPFQIDYAASFHSLDEKIETQAIAGLGTKINWIVSPAHEQLPIEKCSPNTDGSRARWTWKGVTFAREDVLRVWRDWDCFAAWKQAKAHTWRPSKDLSADWLMNLPPGQYVSLSDVITLLAFGPGLIPIGLNNIEENAARFRAGLALMIAAKESKVTLSGRATFRLPRFPGGIAPVSMLAKIEPKFLADMTLVIDGRATGWDHLDSPTNILKSAKERTVLVLSASQFIVNRSDDGSLNYPAKRATKSEGQSSSMIGSPLDKRQIGS
ncbi:MAG: hypothetical protein WBW81_14500 [Methylocella sp.]